MLIWDNHACLPLRPDDLRFLPQLERHRAAGAHMVVLNVGYGDYSLENHYLMIARFQDWIADHPEQYLQVKSVADLEAARAGGRLGVAFNIEGMRAIGDDLSQIGPLYDLGVRWMLIAYNQNNLAGGGCHDEDSGLTPFGRRVIAEMERVGMVLCCSHSGYRTALEAMAAATKPVILSHSNPRALVDHPRNVPDEVMLACAATGGVMGINGVGVFLGRNDISSDNVIRHIDYAVGLIGPEHVGLGLDYVFDIEELDAALEASAGLFPEGWGYQPGIPFAAPEQLVEIRDGLLSRGYPTTDVARIMGRNWLRVAAACWRQGLAPKAADQA